MPSGIPLQIDPVLWSDEIDTKIEIKECSIGNRQFLDLDLNLDLHGLKRAPLP
jgi:hypothetical protein